MAEFKCEVTQKHGILSESSKGWTKELRSISWNDREVKYDIREWSPDHDKMGKGVESVGVVILLSDAHPNWKLLIYPE